MATSQTCLPWFSGPPYQQLLAAGPTFIQSGCGIGADGNINCDPEAMRASAEQQLNAAGYNGSLSLEAYTLARYMQGEVGNGSIQERVAVGEAAVNRAKLEGKDSALDILLYRQPLGHPNRGFYGPIHGAGGVTTAPYGRWATTSADPALLTLLLAKLVIGGDTNNFSNGADDQDGIEYSSAFPNIPAYIELLASRSKFWVGPLPGIDHWKTFLQTTVKGETNQTPWGRARINETLAALEGRVRPTWDPNMPICAKPAGGVALWAFGVLGFLAGAIAFSQGYFRRQS